MSASQAIVIGVGLAGLALAVWWLRGLLTVTKVSLPDVDVYSTTPVTESEARQWGESLQLRSSASSQRISVHLGRRGTTYDLRLPFAAGFEPDDETLAMCEVQLAAFVSEVAPGASAEVHLCDERWHTFRVVPYQARYGKRCRFGAAEVFYTTGVSDDDVQRLGLFLMAALFFNNQPKLVQLNRRGDGYELRLEVKKTYATRPDLQAELRQMAADLSRDVFAGAQVTVEFAESVNETLRPHLSEAIAPRI